MNDETIDHPVYNRIMASGPKRILALDGGGVRGALTLGYLYYIEKTLRDKFGRSNLVLSDYYDLIGGTSTGAIISTFLSLGFPVSEITDLYKKLGNSIFIKRKHFLNRWYLKYFLSEEYDHKILEKILYSLPDLEGVTLGSTKFKTALAIFAKRADTKSTWIFHNNPINKYYKNNKGILLRDLLRASSAAPSYFKPHEIKLDDGESAIFIDGGVSMANNPSLMMFLLATISGYGYKWRYTSNHLLITSIGTGFKKTVINKKSKLLNKKSVSWAKEIPDLFMHDASELNQYLMQFFSNPLNPEKINSEVGSLKGDLLMQKALLEYCRYNVSLGEKTLSSLGFHQIGKKTLETIAEMDQGSNVDLLNKIGLKSASTDVKDIHYPPKFDFGTLDHKPIVLDQLNTISVFKPILDKKGKSYKKFRIVKAKRSDKKQMITSITSSGIETKNEAAIGDYILINQTESKELYVVKKDVFKNNYDFIRQSLEGFDEYLPIGEIVAIKLTKKLIEELELEFHFYITPSWGKKQYIGIGDYIVRKSESDYYRIGAIEFKETYKKVKK